MPVLTAHRLSHYLHHAGQRPSDTERNVLDSDQGLLWLKLSRVRRRCYGKVSHGSSGGSTVSDGLTADRFLPTDLSAFRIHLDVGSISSVLNVANRPIINLQNHAASGKA